VILLSIDTLRADHVGSYGYARPTTPGLDAMAAGGARFASAWAPSPWTLPSHATMLTGLLPIHHGAIEAELALGDRVPLLQQAFQDAGYVTGGFVATLFVSDRFGFERGFQRFDDMGIDDERENLTASPTAEAVLARARAWASEQPPGQPLFLFLHVYDAHYAYDPPAPWDRRFDRSPDGDDPTYKNYDYYARHPLEPAELAHQIAQYDEAIAYVDDTFRRWTDGWTAGGRRAYVAVVSDHGEELGERGSWGHAHTLWPEQLHVPWIVSGPGVTAQVVSERVGLEDVAPTLAGLAGVPWTATDGVDRSGVVRGGPFGGAPSGRYAETSRFRSSKLRWHQDPYDLHLDLARGSFALCDLAADPGCTQEVSAVRPTTVGAMAAALYDWIGTPWVVTSPGTVAADGTFLFDGQRVQKRLLAPAGTRFALFPLDAALTWTDTAGGVAGPWRVLGGGAPDAGQPVQYTGIEPGARPVVLDGGERGQLEALGYVQ
jgi:arylsulfatase A-like enzyme